ncbi:MAG: hypothetical protein IPK25_00900 [Saprospiraceae bacterium]|nr:hypothetical protein [Saprospiraceae bacterium]
MERVQKISLFRSSIIEYTGFFTSLLLLIYVKFFVHELWKDEWQAWFVAKDKNLIEIISFLNYEGHPAIWYFYLLPFTWLSAVLPVPEEYILTFAHVLPASAVLYLFWKKFDLPSLVKISFALSYFLIFEYGVVNRGYIFVILFLFLAVYFLRKENNKGLAWSLFLLCQTEVFGVFMATALGAYWFLKEKKIGSDVVKYLGAGLLIFVISVFPRESGHIAKTQGKMIEFGDRMLVSLQGNLTNAFLPGITPDTSLFGWNTLGVLISLALIVGFIVIFRKEKNLFIPFLLVSIMSFLFSLFFFVGGIRQWGMMFIFLIAILALSDKKLFADAKILLLVIFIGIVQSVYGIKALYSDINLPFSNAKETGLYIKKTIPEKVPVVAINKFEVTPVIGYTQRKFFELPSGEEFSYFKWVEKIYIPTQEELKLFARYKGVGGLVIIAPKKLDPGRFSEARLGKEFTGKNMKNENYYLYTLSAK